MVLESLARARFVLKHPLVMLLLGLVVSGICIAIAYFTFPDESSILAIAFIATAMVPLMYKIFMVEEKEFAERPKLRLDFFTRHFDVLQVYSFFFIGLIISYSFFYAFLPADARETLFKTQDRAVGQIANLRKELSGQAVGTAVCGKDLNCYFDIIFKNNSAVLIWSIIFSFVFGAGAIFLISWNASIIGTVVGRDILGLTQVYNNIGPAYLHGMFNALGFLPHGLPELSSYFIGAIAGGIISAAITKQAYKSNEIQIIARDAFLLIAVAFFLLYIGAVIEAWLIVSA